MDYTKIRTLDRLLDFILLSSLLMHLIYATLSPLYVAFLHRHMLLYAFYSSILSSGGLRHTIRKGAIRHSWVFSITRIIVSRVGQRLLLDINKG